MNVPDRPTYLLGTFNQVGGTRRITADRGGSPLAVHGSTANIKTGSRVRFVLVTEDDGRTTARSVSPINPTDAKRPVPKPKPERSRSVYAIPSGLPGLGKRR